MADNGATGLTPNMKIPIFNPNDTTGWLDGFNPAMQRLDTILNGNKSSLQVLTNKTNANEAKINTNTQAIANQSKLIAEQAVDIQHAQSSANSAGAAADIAAEYANNAERTAETAETTARQAIQNAASTDAKIPGLQSQINSVDTRVQANAQNINTINQTKLPAINTNIERANENIDYITAKINNSYSKPTSIVVTGLSYSQSNNYDIKNSNMCFCRVAEQLTAAFINSGEIKIDSGISNNFTITYASSDDFLDTTIVGDCCGYAVIRLIDNAIVVGSITVALKLDQRSSHSVAVLNGLIPAYDFSGDTGYFSVSALTIFNNPY